MCSHWFPRSKGVDFFAIFSYFVLIMYKNKKLRCAHPYYPSWSLSNSYSQSLLVHGFCCPKFNLDVYSHFLSSTTSHHNSYPNE